MADARVSNAAVASKGYNALSEFIARYPEHSIYRKFGSLGIKRLLYLQAELSRLEQELQVIAEYDQNDHPTLATSWIQLNGISGTVSQRQKMLEISGKLDEYYATLLQTRRILEISKPQVSDLDLLRFWLEWDQGGKCFLKGIESDPYDTTFVDHTNDLVTLLPDKNRDSLTQFLCEKFVPWYHQRFGQWSQPDPDLERGELWEFKQEKLDGLGDMLCAFFSCAIPVASIFLLYYIRGMFFRLIVTAIMNFLFSFFMVGILRGGRVEVFAASTAFAAVQVVFIGGVNIILKK